MTNGTIIDILETLAPRQLACGWDNTGLQTGSRNDAFTGVYIALDAVPDTVQAAVDAGCSLLVTHHPLLFSPVNAVTDETVKGRMILDMARAGLSCYSMHTSFDKAVGGMADLAAGRMGLTGCIPLEEACEDGSGIGRAGLLAEPCTVRQLAERIKAVFGLDAAILYSVDPDRIAARAAVLPGSGRSEWTLALEAGAEVYVTGDMNYHTALDAMQAGLSVIDAGHDGIEKLFVPEIAAFLSQKIQRDDLIYTQKCTNIANYI